MLLLDTCTLIYDALTPERLSKRATDTIEAEERRGRLGCSDISLWEIAMLVEKKRIDPGIDPLEFIRLLLAARSIKVLPVTPEIAVISAALGVHRDPADCIIAATALVHQADLATCDTRLAGIEGVRIVW